MTPGAYYYYGFDVSESVFRAFGCKYETTVITNVDNFKPKAGETVPDLDTQLESLFDAVWKNEAEQDEEARIDQAARLWELLEEKKRKKSDRKDKGVPKGPPSSD